MNDDYANHVAPGRYHDFWCTFSVDQATKELGEKLMGLLPGRDVGYAQDMVTVSWPNRPECVIYEVQIKDIINYEVRTRYIYTAGEREIVGHLCYADTCDRLVEVIKADAGVKGTVVFRRTIKDGWDRFEALAIREGGQRKTMTDYGRYRLDRKRR